MSRVSSSKEVKVSNYLWMDDPNVIQAEFHDLNSSLFLFVEQEQKITRLQGVTKMGSGSV
jgi:hypothetical protein